MAYKDSKALGASLGLQKSEKKTSVEKSSPASEVSTPKSNSAENAPIVAPETPSTTSTDLFPSKQNAVTKNRVMTMKVKTSEHERWKKAAKSVGVSLTSFIETVVNDYCDRNSL